MAVQTVSTSALITGSRLLERISDTYGWAQNTRDVYVGSLSQSVDELADWRVADLQKIIARYAPGSARILDAGSGTGIVSIAAKHQGLDIRGVDNDPLSLALARELAEASGLTSTEIDDLFEEQSLTTLAFPDDHFDVISSHQVIEHVDDRVAMLSELARCLKPGGIMWLVAPDYRFCFEPHYRIPWLPFLNKTAAPAWLAAYEKPIAGLSTFHYISLPECLGHLKSLGLQTIAAKTSAPESLIHDELRTMIDDGSYLSTDPETLRARALSCRRRNVNTTECSFLILCRKPPSASV